MKRYLEGFILYREYGCSREATVGIYKTYGEAERALMCHISEFLSTHEHKKKSMIWLTNSKGLIEEAYTQLQNEDYENFIDYRISSRKRIEIEGFDI